MAKKLLRINDEHTYSFSATRGIQYRPYFQATVPARVLVRMLNIDDQGSTLERSQREVNRKRAEKFAKYLLSNLQKNSFFIIPSLVGVVNTPANSPEPRFFDACDILDIKRTTDNYAAQTVGRLMVHMDSTIKLFDGQHRGTGIAIGFDLIARYPQEFKDVDLNMVQVPIMLFTDLTLEERQLGFTDINMNLAKPSTSISLAYDKRDEVAKLAVMLSSNLPCFKDLVDLEKNVVSSKSPYLFPLKAIYDSICIILGVKGQDIYKPLSDEQVEKVQTIFNTMSRTMGWSGLAFSDFSTEHYRDNYIFTHAVMLKAAAKAGASIYNAFNGFENVDFEPMQALDFGRYSTDFEQRCICPKSGNMIANQTAVQLSANKLMLAVGCPLDTKSEALERQYIGDFEQPTLPSDQVEPEPEPEDTRPFFSAPVKLNTLVTEQSLNDIVIASPMVTESSLTPEQCEEITSKMLTVMSEPMFGGDESDDEYVYPELHKVTFEVINELMTQPTDEARKIALNIRSLRAYLRQNPDIVDTRNAYQIA